MMISKKAIIEHYIKMQEQYLEEILEPLPLVEKKTDLIYLVRSEDSSVSAYYEFSEEDYEDTYGPKLEKENIKCYEVSWDFTEESKHGPSAWTRVTGTAPKVIDSFLRSHEDTDVLFFKGMIGTNTNDLYSKPQFQEHIKTMFGDKFNFVSNKSSRKKFFLIKKDIQLSFDKKIMEKDIKRHGLNESIEYYIQLEKDKKNKYKAKGISKWDLYKEQIERIILKRNYLS